MPTYSPSADVATRALKGAKETYPIRSDYKSTIAEPLAGPRTCPMEGHRPILLLSMFITVVPTILANSYKFDHEILRVPPLLRAL